MCVCVIYLAKWIVPYCLFWVIFFFFFITILVNSICSFFPFFALLPPLHISLCACCFALGRSYHIYFSSFYLYYYYYSDIRLLLSCELMLIKCSYVNRIFGWGSIFKTMC
ncbi:Uncharacterized protein APZ42_002744 [Daphnia magna]|uniref:Uncharacterized protein n=1 Tax=Daphnia magna TaxID=35525 RepID=A0A164I2G9_9CRUS|nr:Uncharacterized protein APZ42_002744 [Daphnia magna]